MMIEERERTSEKPEPFEFYTAADLWTDEHISAQMLSFHLDENGDVASRNAAFIDRSVEWMASWFGIGSGTRIADFGCGPGLYTNRLARLGGCVTGIDFSERSVRHARKAAAGEGLKVAYINQNYLEYETEDRFDLVLMIMCDFCALSPEQRKVILARFHGILRPGGSILLDVYSVVAFARVEEKATYEEKPHGGFWSPGRYRACLDTFRYEEEKVTLDRFTIVGPERTRTVYNWFQYFSPESLKSEFAKAGFAQHGLFSDVAGTPFDRTAPEFAIVGRK
jgi:SAM-dependent methyltransferase